MERIINAGVGFCLVISNADDMRNRWTSFLIYLSHMTIVMFKETFSVQVTRHVFYSTFNFTSVHLKRRTAMTKYQEDPL